jgi:hypothetical protein
MTGRIRPRGRLAEVTGAGNRRGLPRRVRVAELGLIGQYRPAGDSSVGIRLFTQVNRTEAPCLSLLRAVRERVQAERGERLPSRTSVPDDIPHGHVLGETGPALQGVFGGRTGSATDNDPPCRLSRAFLSPVSAGLTPFSLSGCMGSGRSPLGSPDTELGQSPGPSNMKASAARPWKAALRLVPVENLSLQPPAVGRLRGGAAPRRRQRESCSSASCATILGPSRSKQDHVNSQAAKRAERENR